MEFVVIAILIGLIPAAIASSKGRNFFLWWLYGAAIFIVALPHSIVMGPGGSKRKCPHCAESINVEAKVCPHCQRDVPLERCEFCNAQKPVNARSCPSCGRLQPR